ncbi:hypothetical protein BofuT4_P025690.1 [Botrytis cinerea T4]|uniref:Uncharacterized protein n=1 Tax=Botryotinia fuckeliana (strain T4) TaxID=999810 RepID=G2YEH2_BOTF4|nr:hypothetical protein BofuT4_P025690.1 [Botrytis cinerea T4]
MSSFAIAVVMLGMLNESSQEKMIGIGRKAKKWWSFGNGEGGREV